jgi:hypothetical protein
MSDPAVNHVAGWLVSVMMTLGFGLGEAFYRRCLSIIIIIIGSHQQH